MNRQKRSLSFDESGDDSVGPEFLFDPPFLRREDELGGPGATPSASAEPPALASSVVFEMPKC